MRALAGFAKLKVSYADLEFGLGLGPEAGLADSGDLDVDLTSLVAAIGLAAQERETACVLFMDELQDVDERQLASLIAALHSARQAQVPITMVAAGLPQLVGQSGRAKSYTERLFEFVPVDRLDVEAATAAIVDPARREGVEHAADALEGLLAQTRGYPCFPQEWGKHCWNEAVASPIRRADARFATTAA